MDGKEPIGTPKAQSHPLKNQNFNEFLSI